MNKREMLQAMKSKQGEDTMIIFRNGSLYEAYFEDATAIASLLHIPTIDIDEVPTIRIHQDNQLHLINKIIDSGFAVCISAMRDSSGEYVPTISEKQEVLHLYNDEQ